MYQPIARESLAPLARAETSPNMQPMLKFPGRTTVNSRQGSFNVLRQFAHQLSHCTYSPEGSLRKITRKGNFSFAITQGHVVRGMPHLELPFRVIIQSFTPMYGVLRVS